jgi:hypothetical protein
MGSVHAGQPVVDGGYQIELGKIESNNGDLIEMAHDKTQRQDFVKTVSLQLLSQQAEHHLVVRRALHR